MTLDVEGLVYDEGLLETSRGRRFIYKSGHNGFIGRVLLQPNYYINL